MKIFGLKTKCKALLGGKDGATSKTVDLYLISLFSMYVDPIFLICDPAAKKGRLRPSHFAL